MRLCLSPYHLESKTGEVRRGYLLKSQASDQAPGYSDIFPWVEFGDPSFDEIPLMIQNGQSTPLIRKSLYFSRRDALERTAKSRLLSGKTVRNHFFVFGPAETWVESVGAALARGFKSVKIKVGRSPEQEIPVLKKMLDFDLSAPWLRLDFNGSGTRQYFEKIESLNGIVQFVEDPFKDPESWAGWDWPWAFDHPGFPEGRVSYSYRIVKPAKQDWESDENHPLIFTSYLGHPVGIAHAMVDALQSGQQIYDYGLMSQNYYKETKFHHFLNSTGPHLTIAGEYGIGFDDLFDELPWVEI